MKAYLQRLFLCVACLALCEPAAFARGKALRCSSDHGTSVDMPISLAIGTVRTPEFPVKHKLYLIEFEANWNLPTNEIRCMMGFQLTPGYHECKLEPVIETEWTLFDGSRIVARGSDKGRSGDFEAGACYLGRFIGCFTGESRHRYVLEVKFTKDGTPLDGTNPKLVVSVIDGPM